MRFYTLEAALEWLIYAAISVYVLLSQYFAVKGFSPLQIGVLMGIMPVMSLFANAILFKLASIKTRVFVLRITSIFSIFGLWMVYVSTSFNRAFFSMVLFTFFFVGIVPMGEAVVVGMVRRKGFSYGHIRLWGTAGFACFAFLTGILVRGGFVFLFVLLTMILFMVYFLSWKLEDENMFVDKAEKRREKLPAVFWFMLAVVAVIIGVNNFNFIFLPVLAKIREYDISFSGFSFSLMAASEIPFLIFADRMIERIGVRHLLMSGMLVVGLRLILVPMIAAQHILIFVQMMHGWTYIVVYYCAMHVIRRFDVKLQNAAQAALWTSIQGLGAIVGSFIGGSLAEGLGVSSTYFIFGTIALILTFFVFFVARVWNDFLIGGSGR